MAAFANIRPSLWRSSKVRQLEGIEKLIAIYMMTNEHFNMIGLYRLPISLIDSDIALGLAQITAAIERLTDVGFCKYDHDHEVVWVVDMAKTQAIGGAPKPNQKQCKGVANIITRLYEEEYPFIEDWLQLHHKRFKLDPDIDNLAYE